MQKLASHCNLNQCKFRVFSASSVSSVQLPLELASADISTFLAAGVPLPIDAASHYCQKTGAIKSVLPENHTCRREESLKASKKKSWTKQCGPASSWPHIPRCITGPGPVVSSPIGQGLLSNRPLACSTLFAYYQAYARTDTENRMSCN